MLVLVNNNDEPIGEIEKLDAHTRGMLHRAFSVFIINSKNKLLMQQRALNKYHSPGLWTNSCCSHPFPNEDVLIAANRRLFEEMGLNTNLEYLFKFKYKAIFENQLIEHEIDHVFLGYSDAVPKINKKEVNDYRYMSFRDIMIDIKLHPEHYTVWFRIILKRFANVYNLSSFAELSGANVLK